MKIGLGALFLVLVPACGGSDVNYATAYAPNFQHQGRSVAVFGAYKDGRMSNDAWTDLAAKLAPALGGPCEALYGDVLPIADDVARAIDDTTRRDGVTEPLLDLFAPAANGDTILLVTMAGHAKGEEHEKSAAPSAGPAVGGTGRHRGGGGLGAPTPQGHGGGRVSSGRPRDALEMSAVLYDAKTKENIAAVAMTYTGKSENEAIAGFTEKLRAELPGLTCRTWSRDAHVEADKVRAVTAAE